MDKKGFKQEHKKKLEMAYSENANVNQSGYYGPNTYEPLSHMHARQQTFEASKTWETGDSKQKMGPLRHSLEASPSQGMLSPADRQMASKKQKYLQ